MSPAQAPWRSRITGHGEEDPTQLLANPRNWRVHTRGQREAIRGALSEVGWVQSVIVNQTTGHLVDGHARVEESITRGESTVPVVYVELTPEEEAVVLATLDPIGAMAERSEERMAELLREITPTEGVERLLHEVGLRELEPDPSDITYTSKVDVPHYAIVGERPEPGTLYDTQKADQLRAAIEAAEMAPEVRAFLLAATQRHVVFDYRRIAEYYPHASAEVQRLMEASALVIVDYENAIRDGYARFVATIQELEEAEREASDG